jgi:hypothetical protein
MLFPRGAFPKASNPRDPKDLSARIRMSLDWRSDVPGCGRPRVGDFPRLFRKIGVKRLDGFCYDMQLMLNEIREIVIVGFSKQISLGVLSRRFLSHARG